MLRRKISFLLIVLMIVSVAMLFAFDPKDCEDCGVQCDPGECDDAPACSQCVIRNCDMGVGDREDLMCNEDI